jgi:hypothetical protein
MKLISNTDITISVGRHWGNVMKKFVGTASLSHQNRNPSEYVAMHHKTQASAILP